MNRHHPYGTAYEGNRRGGSPPDVGPERRSRFSDRGGPPYRGRGRGRGGGSSASTYSSGGGYDQGTTGGYEGETYNQWNGSQDPYLSQTSGYGNGYSASYSGSADGYDQSGYTAYEDSSSSFGGRGSGRPRRGVPRRETDDKVHDSLIEERIQRERPCRTLFIRNIKYETHSEDVRHKFEEHGEIKTFFDLISNRGMVFVTYYDLRAAERARERLQDMEISGRPIDVHYSLPRTEDQAGREGQDRNQGTVLVTLRNSVTGQPIDENEVRRKLQQFGDIKGIKAGENPHTQRYIEYYDIRSSEEAYERLRHTSLQDGALDITYAWDIPDVPLPPGPIPRRPEERPSRDYNDTPRRGRGGRGRGRRRGGSSDDWDHRDDWSRERDRGGRYDDDDRDRRSPTRSYNSRGPPYGGSSSDNYGPPPATGGSTPAYGHQATAPVAAVDDRLEQARKVQQLLAALKQPQTGKPSDTPPVSGGPPAAPQAPLAGTPNASLPYYQRPPTMQTQPPASYPSLPPGSYPPPMMPQNAVQQQAPVVPPGMPSMPSLANLPPNILALLQHAAQAPQQQQSPPTAAAPMPPPPMVHGQYGMMPPPPVPDSNANPAMNPAYQQLMAYLAQTQNAART